MSLINRISFVANPSYRAFTICDPTCDQTSNVREAFRAQRPWVFAWGPNAVVVNTTIDPGLAAVVIDLWSESAPLVGQPDVVVEQVLELLGGSPCSLEATDESMQRGVTLAAGPGSYSARMSVYNHGVVEQFEQHKFEADLLRGSLPFPGTYEAFLMQVWKV